MVVASKLMKLIINKRLHIKCTRLNPILALFCNLGKSFMKEEDFQNLNLELPRQPLSNERPWFIAGLVFAAALLIFIVCAYQKRGEKKSLKQVSMKMTEINKGYLELCEHGIYI